MEEACVHASLLTIYDSMCCIDKPSSSSADFPTSHINHHNHHDKRSAIIFHHKMSKIMSYTVTETESETQITGKGLSLGRFKKRDLVRSAVAISKCFIYPIQFLI